MSDCLPVNTHRVPSPHLVLLCGCGSHKPSSTGELPKIWGGLICPSFVSSLLINNAFPLPHFSSPLHQKDGTDTTAGHQWPRHADKRIVKHVSSGREKNTHNTITTQFKDTCDDTTRPQPTKNGRRLSWGECWCAICHERSSWIKWSFSAECWRGLHPSDGCTKKYYEPPFQRETGRFWERPTFLGCETNKRSVAGSGLYPWEYWNPTANWRPVSPWTCHVG